MLFSSSDSKNPFNLALIIKYFYHFGLVNPLAVILEILLIWPKL